ncbi:MAG TPA: thiamine-phosphate kinase, partial [bacterium]|nr:thiamine-phosphate kinase [bacterium]
KLKNDKDKKETLGKVGEFGFIEKIRSAMKDKNPNVVLGIGDDAAIFKPTKGHEMVFTTDMLVEGRHFDFKWISPWQLGAKTMAVNVSDCAAMGAKPTAAVVSLGVPANFPLKDLEAFYDGLKGWGEQFGAQVVGGDTVGSDKFVVNVALVGEVETGKALRRSGAKVGDALFVTGTLGDSAAGLHSLQHPSNKKDGEKHSEAHLIKRHLTPVPRFTVGRVLSSKKLASSAIDISDGLSSEVHHLCEESGVGAEIHEEALPISPFLTHYCGENGLNPLEFVLNGGEDYELLFTVPLTRISEAVQKLPAETGTAVKSIGRMVPKSKGITLITKKGGRMPLVAKGFDHFAG